MRSFAEICRRLRLINIMNGGGYELDRKEDLPQVIEALRIADTVTTGGGLGVVRLVAAGLNAGTFPEYDAEVLRSALFAYDVKRAAKRVTPRHLGCPAPSGTLERVNDAEMLPSLQAKWVPHPSAVIHQYGGVLAAGGGCSGAVMVSEGTSTATPAGAASKPANEGLGRAIGVKPQPIVPHKGF